MLQGEAQHHGGIAGRALDVLPGLAAVDEDFAERAVGVAPDGDGEVLTPKPQVKGFARRGVEGGFAGSCRAPIGVVDAFGIKHGVMYRPLAKTHGSGRIPRFGAG